jgi:hypothetical protein
VVDMESPLFLAGLFICSLVWELSSSSCLCLAASEQGHETPAACVSYSDNVSLIALFSFLGKMPFVMQKPPKHIGGYIPCQIWHEH